MESDTLNVPVAEPVLSGRGSTLFKALLPLLALILGGWLVVQKFEPRTQVTVEAENTYGLDRGSAVVWAGKIVGRVESSEVVWRDGRTIARLHLSMDRRGSEPLFDRIGTIYEIRRTEVSIREWKIKDENAFLNGPYLEVFPGSEAAAATPAVFAAGRPSVLVDVRLSRAHGLDAGSLVKEAGKIVGIVLDTELDRDVRGTAIVAHLRMYQDPKLPLYDRAGTSYIVRQTEVAMFEGEVKNLEAFLPGTFLEVVPSFPLTADRSTTFRAVEDMGSDVAPAMAGDIEVRLHGKRAGGLQVGSPVFYAGSGQKVGVVYEVRSAVDGNGSVAFVRVRAEWAPLVCPESKFWDSGRVQLDVGVGELLKGKFKAAEISVDSIKKVVTGSVTFATPPESGWPVGKGHEFALNEKADEKWLSWNPRIGVGSDSMEAFQLRTGHLPVPVVTTLEFQQGLIGNKKRFEGRWIPTDRGLLGFSMLVDVPLNKPSTFTIYNPGDPRRAKPDIKARFGNMVLLSNSVEGVQALPATRIRKWSGSECVVIVPGYGARPIVVADRSVGGDGRLVESKGLGENLRGSPVLSLKDGCLIGMLQIEGGKAIISPLPDAFLTSK